MRAPLSWLASYADLPAGVTGRALAEKLVRAGLEVETVEPVGHDIAGPLVVGEVLAYDEETHSNGKTIRWCVVDIGGEERGIVCGASNFAAGDRVVVALPGATLPGGFEIGARKTYGHVSDGMICSARELGVGADHTGILVLGDAAGVGAPAVEALDLADEVLDIAVTPDRGYCLSIRGIAREAATAYGVGFHDPGLGEPPAADGGGYLVVVEDPAGCDRFVTRTVTGLDPAAPSPWWLARRLHLAGMRPISLAVDVTNHVMLGLGQPLHAYDRAHLSGPIVVRRARAGERLTTLDGVDRTLDPDDLLITDDSGPIGIAGVMGGAGTGVSGSTTDVVIEAAHFDPPSIARAARRHRLPSEASKRFERGVDPEVAAAAADWAARLLAQHGGARADKGSTDVRAGHGADAAASRQGNRPVIRMRADHPGRVAGVTYPAETVVRRLCQVGAAVVEDGELAVTPPTWRPDLVDPNDLAEEVIRLEGYDEIPAALPAAPAGRGLTGIQRARRRVGRALANAGYVEVTSYPFVGALQWDALLLPTDDPRRRALRLANPLAETEPLLRTTLLPGLLAVLRLNVSRGANDVALFEAGLVYLQRGDSSVAQTGSTAPKPAVDRRPSASEIAALEAALPEQPLRIAAVLAGKVDRPGWWGAGRDAGWQDAIESARTVARGVGVEVGVTADPCPPWHPGRCAALRVGDELAGHAGELHPRAIEALELPQRTAAMELDLGMLLDRLGAPVPAPVVSAFPVATLDAALVVDTGVPAAQIAGALRDGAGSLLESLRLFDVYTGAQVGEGRKSLAFSLRFRAPDRTLTTDEAMAARDAAIAEAARRWGAALRS